MEFLKRNLFVIVCLVVGLGSIGLGFLACNSYDAIQESLDQAASFGTQLSGAGKVSGRKDPIVPIDIEVQKQNKETMQGAIQEALQTALVVNETDLDYLVPEAFPDAKITDTLDLEFMGKYDAAIEALPELLDAKGPPGREEIDRMQQIIEEENEAMGTETKHGSTPRAATPKRSAPRDERRGGSMAVGGGTLRGLQDAFGGRATGARPKTKVRPEAATDKPVDEKEQLRTNATRRAELKRAQEVRCYVDSDPKQTFTVVRGASDPTASPSRQLMWRAQMTLWVQREICEALADVNDEAAKALRAKDPEARVDVTTLPIKRVVKLAVGDYRASAVEEPAEQEKARGPSRSRRRRRMPAPKPKSRDDPSDKQKLASVLAMDKEQQVDTTTGRVDIQRDLVGPTWTGRQGGAMLDVVPLAVQLVMDVRYVPRVLDAVCRTNFIVPTRVEYRQLPRKDLEGPYVYGAAPLAEVTLAFERYFFPQVKGYAEKMPPEVHERLGHPVADEEEQEGTSRSKRGTGRSTRRSGRS